MTEPFKEGVTLFVTHPDMEEHLRNLRDPDGNPIFPEDYEFQVYEVEDD